MKRDPQSLLAWLMKGVLSSKPMREKRTIRVQVSVLPVFVSL